MWIPEEEDKFSSKWKYVEIARYVPSLDKVIREKDGDQPRLVTWEEALSFADKYNNTGIYTSVFRYDNPNLFEATPVSSLYFDLDSDDTNEALTEARILYNYFIQFVPDEAIRIYFTGAKGFHIELEAIALGITPTKNLDKIFRFIATDLKNKFELKTLDFSVYDKRRMWRLAGSKHQKTGLYKNDIGKFINSDIKTIEDICKDKFVIYVPVQEFNMRANEWFRSYVYQMEEEKQASYMTPESLLERFKKHGSGVLINVDEERIFDPQGLFESCPAILGLWEKAETKHHLEHEERLFLCSILTYTDEAIFYLHEILRNTSDYNFEKSQAHIDDWVKRRELGIGGRPYTCERANSAGIGCGDCNLEPKKKWQRVGDSYIETDEYSSPSPIRYAYRRKRD